MPETLKDRVRGFWEEEACGTRYAEQNENRFVDIERTRYDLIPWLKPLARFEEGSGKQVLEIGVGAGTDFVQWAKHGAHVTGIDLTDAAINETAGNLAFRGLKAKELKRDDAENLSFADDSFDIVYSWGVLHHSPDTRRALSEAVRVMKPGGRLTVMIYHSPCVSDVVLWVRHGLMKGRPFRSFKDIVFNHLESIGTKAYSVRQAREMAEAAGLRNIKTTTHLGQGDTLEMKLSRKYAHPVYRIVQALYPTWLVKNVLGDRFGRGLVIEATK